eukprot:GHVS01051437.1.p1 GENE.GHVS01051437.1~~GHVS01051437.1.p1  ORF type:complete len:261 (+),score=42.69 GHVS01051437.1:315-1097(+)
MLDISVEAHVLQRLVASVKALCPVLKFSADAEDGLSMQCLDECRSCVARFELKPESCQFFCCADPLDFALNTGAFEGLLATVASTDTVKLNRGDTDDTLKVEAVLFADRELKETMRARLNLLDLPSEELQFQDDIEGAGVVTMNSKLFAKEMRVCKQMGHVSVVLEVSRNSLLMEATGATKYRRVFSRGQDGTEIRCSRVIRQEFGLHYVFKFSKAAVLGKTVCLQLSDHRDSIFEFRLCDLKGEQMSGRVVFQLAPSLA